MDKPVKKNPLAIFIPCHRVVGKDNYGGYMGRDDALPYKLALLKHEEIKRWKIFLWYLNNLVNNPLILKC